MRRLVAVLANSADDALALAMAEDVVDLVTSMREVTPVLVVARDAPDAVRALVWPGTPVVDVEARASIAEVMRALDGDEACVVAADVPDLPPLLLGKLHSALTSHAVAVCPDDRGGIVALATRLPAPAWIDDTGVRLDDEDALARLRAAAPPRGLHVGPGWHRVRTADDALALDAGLEGWEATRALLGR